MTDLALPATILVVDDTPENLAVLGGILQTQYRVQVANCGQRALAIAGRSPRPDLILLDVMMPEMDGYAVLAQLRSAPPTRDIPVIFVTALDSDENEEYGLDQGAVDYIAKPVRPAIVLARVKAHLELKKARDWLSDQNTWLEQEIARRMHENLLIQDVSIRALASLAEIRDMETGHHILRTQAYVDIITQRLRDHPRFSAYLTASRARMVTKAAPLHDIGKVGIPDHILMKPARLTQDEYEVMKRHSHLGSDAIDLAMSTGTTEEEAAAMQRHCQLGGQAIDQAVEGLEMAPLGFLAVARDIARHHHEKWDGSGYPDGLAGDAIPIAARIMAVADVFDALTSRRVYKPPLSVEQSVGIIREASGSHFDPDVVEAFLASLDACMGILRRFADTDETLARKIDAMRLQGLI
jgi:putative two-component system response regulator